MEQPIISPLLHAQDLVLAAQRGRPLSQPLQLQARAGELVALLGANGIGKSTLLRTLAGLHPAQSGQIWVAGRGLGQRSNTERARLVSVVLTQRSLPALLTVHQLVMLGRQPHTNWWGKTSALDHQAVHQALAAVQATHLADRPLQALSDGERQRVEVARALAQDAALLLLDEPSAFLDVSNRVALLQLLRELSQRLQRAIVFSTHEVELALRFADQLWLAIPGPNGMTVRTGMPEDLVLDGSVAVAFANTQVRFEPAQGTFVPHLPNHAPTVGLLGAGLTAEWTKRALERVGFSVTPGAAEKLVEAVETTVQVTGDGWWVYQAKQRHFATTLQAVLALLER